ncbi:MAG: hypothetical protein WDO13_09560 [Verrucomicrobiota bacterium]
MPVTRTTTLLGGPALAIYNGHTLVARDGNPGDAGAGARCGRFGCAGHPRCNRDGGAGENPVPRRRAPFADLVALYLFLDGAPGTPLFGASDVPLVLVAANGVRLTFAAVAIAQMPDLALGVRGARRVR